jgi:hypothetical protein
MRLKTSTPFAAVALLGCLISATPSAAAVDSFFDIFTELSVSAPPYPSGSIITVVGTSFGGSFQPSQEVQIEMLALSLNGLPPGEPWTERAQGGGGGSGGSAPSIDSFFDIFYEVQLPPTPVTGRRISDIRIVHPPGTPPGMCRLVPIDPLAAPGSVDSFFDIFIESSFFDITYRVADDTGEHTYHTHVTSPSGRMSFFDVFVELRNPAPYPNGTVDSFFDVFADFQLAGPPSSAPDMSGHTTGQFEGGATPAARNTWGAIKQLYR